MQLKYKRLHPKAKLNYPAKAGDVGYDVMGVKAEIITNKSGEKLLKVYTGIAIEMPELPETLKFNGFEYVCKGNQRSSIKDHPFILSNCVGLVDTGYRGEIFAYFRLTKPEHLINVDDIERFLEKPILQLTFEICQNRFEIIESSDISSTERGAGGFGSSNT